MRKFLLIVSAATLVGCASAPARQPKSKLLGEPPKTATIAPHSQARRSRQQEERRAALDEGIKIEGATVVR